MPKENKIEFADIHITVSDREPIFQFLNEENIEHWAELLASHAQKGAAMGKDCGRMCDDCAFKFNQPHNADYLESVDGAALMLAFNGRFNCHTSEKQDAGHSCVGFEYAKLYMNSLD